MRRILLDTQLLVVLTIGAVDPDAIRRHRRSRSYTREDYDLLLNAIRGFKSLLLCPNVVSEASNLLRYGDEDARLSYALRRVVEDSDETWVDSKIAVGRPEYRWLGATHAALLEIA